MPSVLDKYQDDTADWNLSGLMPHAGQIVLKKGASGQYIADLQTNLTLLGYKAGIDSRFGAQTEQAVKDFQRDNGLTVDGWAGSQDRCDPGSPPSCKSVARPCHGRRSSGGRA